MHGPRSFAYSKPQGQQGQQGTSVGAPPVLPLTRIRSGRVPSFGSRAPGAAGPSNPLNNAVRLPAGSSPTPRARSPCLYPAPPRLRFGVPFDGARCLALLDPLQQAHSVPPVPVVEAPFPVLHRFIHRLYTPLPRPPSPARIRIPPPSLSVPSRTLGADGLPSVLPGHSGRLLRRYAPCRRQPPPRTGPRP